MATLQISDDVEALLESASKRTGRTPAELAEEILHDHLQQVDPPLSMQQIDRIEKSLAQARHGELIPSEQVDSFFEDWFAELRAR